MYTNVKKYSLVAVVMVAILLKKFLVVFKICIAI